MAVVNTENDVKLFVFIYIDHENKPQYLFDYENKFSDLNNVDINYFKTNYGIDWRTDTKELREELKKTFIMGEITKKDKSYNVKLTDTTCSSDNNGGILNCKPDESEINIKVEESFIEKLEPLFQYAENYSIVKDYNCKLLIQKYSELQDVFSVYCRIMKKLMFYLLNGSPVDGSQLESESESELPFYKQNIPSFIDAFTKMNEKKITTQDIDNIFQNMYNSFLSTRQLSSIIGSIIQNTNQPLALKNDVESKEEELQLTTPIDNKLTTQYTIEHIISGILNNINKDYEFNNILAVIKNLDIYKNYIGYLDSYLNQRKNTIGDFKGECKFYLPLVNRIYINNLPFLKKLVDFIKNNNITQEKYTIFLRCTNDDITSFQKCIEIKNNSDKYTDEDRKLQEFLQKGNPNQFIDTETKGKKQKCNKYILLFLKKFLEYQYNIQFLNLITNLPTNPKDTTLSDIDLEQLIKFWVENDNDKQNNNEIKEGSIVRISYRKKITDKYFSISIGIIKSMNQLPEKQSDNTYIKIYTISMYNLDEQNNITYIGIFEINSNLLIRNEQNKQQYKYNSIQLLLQDNTYEFKILTYSIINNKNDSPIDTIYTIDLISNNTSNKKLIDKNITKPINNNANKTRVVNVAESQNTPSLSPNNKAYVNKSDVKIRGNIGSTTKPQEEEDDLQEKKQRVNQSPKNRQLIFSRSQTSSGLINKPKKEEDNSISSLDLATPNNQTIGDKSSSTNKIVKQHPINNGTDIKNAWA